MIASTMVSDIFSSQFSLSLDGTLVPDSRSCFRFLRFYYCKQIEKEGNCCSSQVAFNPLTLIRAAIKKCIEWRLQVQIAFSTEVDLALSRPE
jgi:hypothetical protein